MKKKKRMEKKEKVTGATRKQGLFLRTENKCSCYCLQIVSRCYTATEEKYWARGVRPAILVICRQKRQSRLIHANGSLGIPRTPLSGVRKEARQGKNGRRSKN